MPRSMICHSQPHTGLDSGGGQCDDASAGGVACDEEAGDHPAQAMRLLQLAVVVDEEVVGVGWGSTIVALWL